MSKALAIAEKRVRRELREREAAAKFIADARKIHGDKYDYSRVVYTNARIKVTIVCPGHGSFEQTPCGHLKANVACPRCSLHSSQHPWSASDNAQLRDLWVREISVPEIAKKLGRRESAVFQRVVKLKLESRFPSRTESKLLKVRQKAKESGYPGEVISFGPDYRRKGQFSKSIEARVWICDSPPCETGRRLRQVSQIRLCKLCAALARFSEQQANNWQEINAEIKRLGEAGEYWNHKIVAENTGFAVATVLKQCHKRGVNPPKKPKKYMRFLSEGERRSVKEKVEALDKAIGSERMCVYIFHCTATGKVYIGKTGSERNLRRTFRHRLNEHLETALDDQMPGRGSLFYRALCKHRPEGFDCRVLGHAATSAELNALEKHFIARYKANDPVYGYNLTSGGDGGEWSEEARKRQSRRMKGKPVPQLATEEARAKRRRSIERTYDRYHRVNLTCAQCGESFKTWKSNRENGAKYCSVECGHAAKRGIPKGSKLDALAPEIERCAAEGLSIPETARRLGIKAPSLQAWSKNHSEVAFVNGRKKLRGSRIDWLIPEITKLAGIGLSKKEIADRSGVNYSMFRVWAKEHPEIKFRDGREQHGLRKSSI